MSAPSPHTSNRIGPIEHLFYSESPMGYEELVHHGVSRVLFVAYRVTLRKSFRVMKQKQI
jgi:hypothetical protein